jgi:polyphosphate glucokinase
MEQTKQKILGIDIGGSHIKAVLLDEQGNLTSEYQKRDTPEPANPESVVATIQELASLFPEFDKVSAGFPGYVRDGIVWTAPNLDAANWRQVNLAEKLGTVLGKPVKVVNDADLQGLGLAQNKGLELIITLGTGFGTALVYNGQLLPHLEMAHHPVTKKKTYDEYIGEKALEDIGEEEWNERMKRVLDILKTVFNYDHLYISGGNAKKLNVPLEENMTIRSNKDGIKGGARLWQQA